MTRHYPGLAAQLERTPSRGLADLIQHIARSMGALPRRARRVPTVRAEFASHVRELEELAAEAFRRLDEEEER